MTRDLDPSRPVFTLFRCPPPHQLAAQFMGPSGGRVAPGLVGVRGLGRAREPRDGCHVRHEIDGSSSLGKGVTCVEFLRRFRFAAARRRRLGLRLLPWCLRAGRGNSTGEVEVEVEVDVEVVVLLARVLINARWVGRANVALKQDVTARGSFPSWMRLSGEPYKHTVPSPAVPRAEL